MTYTYTTVQTFGTTFFFVNMYVRTLWKLLFNITCFASTLCRPLYNKMLCKELQVLWSLIYKATPNWTFGHWILYAQQWLWAYEDFFLKLNWIYNLKIVYFLIKEFSYFYIKLNIHCRQRRIQWPNIQFETAWNWINNSYIWWFWHLLKPDIWNDRYSIVFFCLNWHIVKTNLYIIKIKY